MNILRAPVIFLLLVSTAFAGAPLRAPIAEIESSEAPDQAIELWVNDVYSADVGSANAALLNLAAIYRHEPASRETIQKIFAELEAQSHSGDDDPKIAFLSTLSIGDGIVSAWTAAYAAGFARAAWRLYQAKTGWSRKTCGRYLGRATRASGPGKWPFRAKLSLLVGGATAGALLVLGDAYDKKRIRPHALLERTQALVISDLLRELESLEREISRRGLDDAPRLAQDQELGKNASQLRTHLLKRDRELQELNLQQVGSLADSQRLARGYKDLRIRLQIAEKKALGLRK